MAIDMNGLLNDLEAETEQLVKVLRPLGDSEWDLPTPAAGWTIRDQVSHLAYFDEAAQLALEDPEKFKADAAVLGTYGDSFPDEIAKRYRSVAPSELLNWLKAARTGLLEAFSGVDARQRLAWYGPDMSAASSLTARLMETFAHGVDILDTLKIPIVATNRLAHIAHLGYSTRGFSYAIRGLELPKLPVRMELLAPDGTAWNYGPQDAKDVVSASALDFCLVVTQRRNLSDTQIVASGPIASQWMEIAQAYAGPPGPGRETQMSN
ncbi:MAG: TIGR03084 family metal-binding protein [Actinomycetota bacterium]|nr:TIGR03084 family metal-binding protein [Actinomycetota bacterium]